MNLFQNKHSVTDLNKLLTEYELIIIYFEYVCIIHEHIQVFLQLD